MIGVTPAVNAIYVLDVFFSCYTVISAVTKHNSAALQYLVSNLLARPCSVSD